MDEIENSNNGGIFLEPCSTCGKPPLGRALAEKRIFIWFYCPSCNWKTSDGQEAVEAQRQWNAMQRENRGKESP